MPEPSTILTATLLAVVPSAIYLLVLNAIDRYEKEPWTILLAGLGLGAIAAPIVSVIVLVLAGRPLSLAPEYAIPAGDVDALVGIVQEVVKGLLLLLLIHSVRDEFDDVLDGVVYGAAVGAGFGAAESFVYALGGTGTLNTETIVALVIAGLNNAFYTAVFGGFVGYSRRLPRNQATIVIVLGLATAAFLHAFHDTLPIILSRVLNQPGAATGFVTRAIATGLNVLGILTLAVVVVLAWRREARVLQTELKAEVDAGVVTTTDYATITSFGGRLGRQAALLRSGGMSRVLELRRLYAAEGELAFHKRRMAVRSRRPPPSERGDELRSRILALRAAIGEGAGS